MHRHDLHSEDTHFKAQVSMPRVPLTDVEKLKYTLVDTMQRIAMWYQTLSRTACTVLPRC
eukprot:m.90540 g.90540  ORF g.90540 m.90540 type:complete len:60 (+) comp20131_c0_seq2:5547-5726(+)